jgi:ribonuclease E
VSIDINSGRSTREHNIEQTAFATNLEAAHEIARQLRLRDMAGLVVIDFIDMEQSSHVRKVEKAMKEALKNDRARIQVGRISSFGLMEMSRQRLRTGVLEASTKACPHCEGTGLMRTASSAGLSALRIIEDEAARGRGERIVLRAGREAAIYLLNRKRTGLAEIEARYGVTVEVMIDEAFEGARMSVESSGPRPSAPPRPAMEAPVIEDDEDLDLPEEDEEEKEEDEGEDEGRREPREAREPREPREEGDAGSRRRRRRRRGGRGRRREGEPQDRPETAEEVATDEAEVLAEEAAIAGDEAESALKPRRGRRGGRGRRGRGDSPEPVTETADTVEADSSPMVERPIADEPPIAEAEEAKPKTRRRPRAQKAIDDKAGEAAPGPAPKPEAPAEAASKPKRKSRAKKAEAPAETAPEPAPAPSSAANNDQPAEDEGLGEDGEPRRGGWWQRTFG